MTSPLRVIAPIWVRISAANVANPSAAVRNPVIAGRCSAMPSFAPISSRSSVIPDRTSAASRSGPGGISAAITARRLDTPTTGTCRPRCRASSSRSSSTISRQRRMFLSVLVTTTISDSTADPVRSMNAISGAVSGVLASHTITNTHACDADASASTA
ncbi:hypothetical protein [Rhodococcus sp. USK13]|uniref:hypothetical protein n=1 Tax=Rhodococcus sp. USK13 TaxID=2806442 RepID=UPI0020165BA4|nr:hypothetical protein [Rhodococcus sp. USK13]